MDPRVLLHERLEEIGVKYRAPVYFQPPSNVRLTYPCILYKRATANTRFADDNPYAITKHYTITIIDLDPESRIPDEVALLPSCKHETTFITDNLNHDVYDVYV